MILVVKRRMNIEIGAIGSICFAGGSYAYVGSAMNGLESRLGRYLRPQRKLRWHIDYLLEHAQVKDIVAADCGKSYECELSQRLRSEWPVVEGFGSSDCRCPGHLFGPAPFKALSSSIYRAFDSCGLKSISWKGLKKHLEGKGLKEAP